MKTLTRSRNYRLTALLGFVAGFAMTFAATFLALMTPLFELLHPVLVPGAALLAPLSDRMANWNGALNMTLGGIANGAVYAAVALVVVLAVDAVRRR